MSRADWSAAAWLRRASTDSASARSRASRPPSAVVSRATSARAVRVTPTICASWWADASHEADLLEQRPKPWELRITVMRSGWPPS